MCKDHSKKRREDPSKPANSASNNTSSLVSAASNASSANNNNNNSSLNLSANKEVGEYEKKNFKRICDVCEDKYLKWQINFDFQKNKEKYENITSELERKQKNTLDVIK